MKAVLFLSLSGVRVREAELLKLGMTLPGFVDRGKTIARLPSLGLLTLAALTPPDWEVQYRDVDVLDDATVTELCGAPFGLIAISALTARILDAYALAFRLREAGKNVVIGGLHVSALPDEAAQHADAIVIGEGEAVWPQLLEDYKTGSLRRFYGRETRGRYPFKHAPLPRYELLNPDAYNRLTIQTTRGCPLDCEFCAASRLISTYKHKPLELVQRDLERILEIWPRPFLELADDNTFVNKGWSQDLARLLRRYPVRWFTETDISVADSEELLDLLAESGCVQLLIGLESVAEQSLVGMDSRGWKRGRRTSYLESIEKLQSRGISVNGCFTLGLDEDTPEIFQRTRDFVDESGLSEVQITVMTPFPGTKLYQRLQNEGRLLHDGQWDYYTLFDVTYQPARMSVTDLEQGFAWLMNELYSVKASAQRKEHFGGVLRRSVARQRRSKMGDEDE